MNINGIEIERKFLICRPDETWLEENGEGTDIVQTYLTKRDKGLSCRVRRRSGKKETVYTYTEKRHISSIKREEYEREIDEKEYNELLLLADPGRRTVEKRRYVLPYRGQDFEIDIYPFWNDRAIMEIELERENQAVDFPPQIRIIKEVTQDRRYTNSAIAREIPSYPLGEGTISM